MKLTRDQREAVLDGRRPERFDCDRGLDACQGKYPVGAAVVAKREVN